MLYVFEDSRIIYDKQYLTESDEGRYVAVEELPDPDIRKGYRAVPYADLTAGEVVYRYEKEEGSEQEKRIEELELALLELTELVMGGL